MVGYTETSPFRTASSSSPFKETYSSIILAMGNFSNLFSNLETKLIESASTLSLCPCISIALFLASDCEPAHPLCDLPYADQLQSALILFR